MDLESDVGRTDRPGKERSVKLSVFVGTSLDGFIARANGDFDFLFPGGSEPHGYDEFMATVDALVIGRKTYEKVLTFTTWPYGEKPVFVLSTHTLLPAPQGAVVERMAGDPVEIVSQLGTRGVENVYVDGGITVQRFPEAGLMDHEMTDTCSLRGAIIEPYGGDIAGTG